MSERLRKIVERLELRRGDRVLEIGCGHGVAASMVCEALGSGSLVAIDRSPAMIARARVRNRVHVEAGRATFAVMDLEALALGRRTFDVIFAVRVGLFHRERTRAEARVAPYLARAGRLVVVYDTP